MANPYYSNTTTLIAGTKVRANDVESKFNVVQTGFDSAYAEIILRAPIASPTFTGTPRVPTPSLSSNDTTIPTTAWVTTKIGNSLVGYASTIRETQTATASQTVFNLSNTYAPGTSSLNIYINGIRQFTSAYSETTNQRVTFTNGLTAGDVVLFEIGVITSGTSTAASAVSFNPTSTLTSTTVQDAISEVQTKVTGSGGQTTTGDITLTSTSGAAITVTPATHGLYVTLPDATTCSKADNLFSIYNAGDFDYGVKNSAGTQLGWVRARTGAMIGLSDNTTAAGVWAYYGLEKTGVTASYTNPTLTECGSYVRSIVLDANRNCFLFGRTACYAIVYDASTKTWGSPALVRSGTGVKAFIGVLSATDQVLVVSNNATTAMEAVTLSISGNVVTVNSAQKHAQTIGGNWNGYGQLIAVGSSFVIGYTRATTVTAIRAISISGNTPTIGAESTLTTVTINDSYHLFASGSIVRTLALTALTTTMTCKPFTVSGSTLTVGTSATATVTNGTWRAFINGNGNIVCHYANSSHYASIFKLNTGTVTEVASSVSLGTIYTASFNTNTDYLAVTASKTAFFWGGTNNTYYVNILTDTNGTASAPSVVQGQFTSMAVSVAAIHASGNFATFVANSVSSQGLFTFDCSTETPSLAELTTIGRSNGDNRVVASATDNYGVRSPYMLKVANGVIATMTASTGYLLDCSFSNRNCKFIPTVGTVANLGDGGSCVGNSPNESIFTASFDNASNYGISIQRIEAAA